MTDLGTLREDVGRGLDALMKLFIAIEDIGDSTSLALEYGPLVRHRDGSTCGGCSGPVPVYLGVRGALHGHQPPTPLPGFEVHLRHQDLGDVCPGCGLQPSGVWGRRRETLPR